MPDKSVLEPLRKELRIFLEQGHKIAVEHVGHTVVGVGAYDAPARLHDGGDGLQGIPFLIDVLFGFDLFVSQVGVGYFGDDLKSGQIVIEAETFRHGGTEQDGRRAVPGVLFESFLAFVGFARVQDALGVLGCFQVLEDGVAQLVAVAVDQALLVWMRGQNFIRYPQ